MVRLLNIILKRLMDADVFVVAPVSLDEYVSWRRAGAIYGPVKIINYTNGREGCSIRPHSGERSAGRVVPKPAGAEVSSLRVCGMSDLLPATTVESRFRRRKTSAAALLARVPVVVLARKRVT